MTPPYSGPVESTCPALHHKGLGSFLAQQQTPQVKTVLMVTALELTLRMGMEVVVAGPSR